MQVLADPKVFELEWVHLLRALELRDLGTKTVLVPIGALKLRVNLYCVASYGSKHSEEIKNHNKK